MLVPTFETIHILVNGTVETLGVVFVYYDCIEEIVDLLIDMLMQDSDNDESIRLPYSELPYHKNRFADEE